MRSTLGRVSGDRQYFVDSFIEIVGYNTGIIIDESQLFEFLSELGDFSELLKPDGDNGARLHSVEVEEITAFLLHRLGNTRSPSIMNSHIAMHYKYKENPEKFTVFLAVSEMYVAVLRRATEEARNKPPETRDRNARSIRLHEGSFSTHGVDGGEMALEMINGTNEDMHRSPWGSIRSVEWADQVELKELFESENLEASYGSFFDQRFIDYLHQNFGKIGEIHWRKFEGLAGEYFEREGFRVDVGPGRNDDGIDLRIHREVPSDADPALIIVQCKRQKAKIDKALVKSVYEDVLHEKAQSGLIVTTSSLSPVAALMRNARGYPVGDADCENLREWLRKMRIG